MCILLCQKYRQSRRVVDSGKVTYKSRWKLIISEYNSIRARILNSPVLEETNLMLYSINETTLIKWFKNEVRRDEITLLMQGLTPPQQPLCANESLPPARKLPSSPGPPPDNPHIITEPEDTTGTIRSRVSRKLSTPALSGHNTLSASSPSVTVNPLCHLDPSRVVAALSSFGLLKPPTASPSHPMAVLSSPGPSGLVNPPTAAGSSHPMAFLSSPGPSGLVNPPTAAGPSHPMAVLSSPSLSGLANLPTAPSMSNSNLQPSRTTMWRHKRERQEGKISRPRKAYTCTVCGRPMTSEGHTQFRGQRYCPSAPGQLPQDEWLQKKKDETARH